MENDSEFSFDSKKALNALIQMLLGPLKNLFNFGGITEGASAFGVDMGDMLNPLTEGWDEAMRGITRAIDQPAAAAEDAALAVFNSATVFSQIGTCFGGACIVGTPGDLDKVMKAMFASMPTDNSPASQRQVVKAVLETRTQLVDYFAEKLSTMYPNATEAQITTAADKIAEQITGYPAIDTENRVAMNRIPAPRAGSFGALMLASLERARSATPDSVTIPAFTVDASALTAIKTEMTSAAPPAEGAAPGAPAPATITVPPAVQTQIQAWIAANAAKPEDQRLGFTSGSIADTNGNGKVDAVDIAAVLVRSGADLSSADKVNTAINAMAKPITRSA